MTAPGVGPITAIAVVGAFHDAAWFRLASSVGAHLGLTPRRYESGEISRNRNDADPQHDRMRPAGTRGKGDIDSKTAAMTAHTTSIHPTLNANMRYPLR